jgi:hypothetical protein
MKLSWCMPLPRCLAFGKHARSANENKRVSALAACSPSRLAYRGAGMASQDDALAVAERAPLTLAALPHALLLEVLSSLPADCRLRSI